VTLSQKVRCADESIDVLCADLRRECVVHEHTPRLSPELGLQSGLRLDQLVVGDVQSSSASVDTQSGRVAQPRVVRHDLAHESQSGADVELHHTAIFDVQNQ